ncbi:tripartite tricarboxylate transporter TctB family protein [Microbaculum marinum]|uniref:Tripartite tricarboxylate transporter TctB family protein n=1 Tax=Microbaculum marinum TaxID=1764581 RepID=A0AAW9RQY8_9HYPH
MRVNNLALALIALVLGGGVLGVASTFPSPRHQAFGPALFPSLIGLALVGCGVVLAVQWWLADREAPLLSLAPWMRSPATALNVAMLLAIPVFYIFAVDRLGFVPTAFICLWLMLVRYHGRPVLSLFGAAAAAAILQFVFADILLVPLPWGLLQPLAW